LTLILGMILDALLGEPRWLWSRVPHPAVLMGRVIGWCDAAFNEGDSKRFRGTVLILWLWFVAGVLGWLVQLAPGFAIDAIILAVLLAQKSLAEHVQAAGDALRLSLGDGRRSVARIVGRDTMGMDGSAVARSAIESAAENLSDGVIAPIFWFAVAGLPGLLIYKVTNTADSMIGYRTPRHADFGWASAKLDDLLNLIPARLTALFIWTVTSRPDIKAVLREAPRHRSPNAGWPEAAMAYGQDIALSGPRSYDGALQDYPFVNAKGARLLGPDDIDRTVTVLWKTWALTLALAFAGAVLAALF